MATLSLGMAKTQVVVDFTNLYNNNAEFRSDITDATFGRAANYYDTPC